MGSEGGKVSCYVWSLNGRYAVRGPLVTLVHRQSFEEAQVLWERPRKWLAGRAGLVGSETFPLCR